MTMGPCLVLQKMFRQVIWKSGMPFLWIAMLPRRKSYACSTSRTCIVLTWMFLAVHKLVYELSRSFHQKSRIDHGRITPKKGTTIWLGPGLRLLRGLLGNTVKTGPGSLARDGKSNARRAGVGCRLRNRAG